MDCGLGAKVGQNRLLVKTHPGTTDATTALGAACARVRERDRERERERESERESGRRAVIASRIVVLWLPRRARI